MGLLGLSALEDELDNSLEDLKFEIQELKFSIAETFLRSAIENSRRFSGSYQNSWSADGDGPVTFKRGPSTVKDLFPPPRVQDRIFAIHSAPFHADVHLGNTQLYADVLEESDSTMANALHLTSAVHRLELVL